jgi:hypothetical protein
MPGPWGSYRVRFSCPYLAGEVELTEEREKHIVERHPELVAHKYAHFAFLWLFIAYPHS